MELSTSNQDQSILGLNRQANVPGIQSMVSLHIIIQFNPPPPKKKV